MAKKTTKKRVDRNKIFIGCDPSFKGFGVCTIVPYKKTCFINTFKAPFVVKNIIGYTEAALGLSKDIDEWLWKIRHEVADDFLPWTMVIAEHPPAGGGGNAMSTQPLYALGAIFYAYVGQNEYMDRRYFTVPPSKAGWMAQCPAKIGRTDKKRLTKEFAIALLGSCNFDVTHRGKHIGDVTKMTTKAGKPKPFKMNDNEAEAFLYALLAMRTEHADMIPLEGVEQRTIEKHWTFQPETS